ncbi:MAG: riboflavin kinase [Rikenellaceae bacterium]
MTKKIVKGKVIHGRKLGRELGFPTANIETDKEHDIEIGVWLVKVAFEGEKYWGIANIGKRPTVEKEDIKSVLEVNIFDFSKDLYENSIEVEFVSYLRPEKKFSSLNELKKGINEDILLAQKLIKGNF